MSPGSLGAIPCESPQLTRWSRPWTGLGSGPLPEPVIACRAGLQHTRTHASVHTRKCTRPQSRARSTLQFFCSLEQGRQLETLNSCVALSKALPLLEPQFPLSTIRAFPVLTFANASRQTQLTFRDSRKILLSWKGLGQLRPPEAHTRPALGASLWSLGASASIQ